MFTFEKSAGIIIFRKEKGETLFLLLRYVNGHWDFPKGHIEEGETAKEAALRELDEETEIRNVDVIEGFEKNSYYFFRAKGREREEREKAGQEINIFKRVEFFLGETKTEDVVVSERQDDYIWLPYEKAVKKATHKNAKKLIKGAKQYLKK
jgi:8-oxo-dGTP pyrophosphatase MutT (NUDIX family)